MLCEMFHVEQFRLFLERDDAGWWANLQKRSGNRRVEMLIERQRNFLVTSIRPLPTGGQRVNRRRRRSCSLSQLQEVSSAEAESGRTVRCSQR